MDVRELVGDRKKSVEGVWSVFEGGYDFEVKIARLGNDKYEKYLAKLLKPFTVKRRNRELESSVLKEITRKAMAKYIWIDWKNLTNGDGKAIPYSEEKALEYLSDPFIYDRIDELTNSREIYLQDIKESSVKN